jgi:hypothetical protein
VNSSSASSASSEEDVNWIMLNLNSKQDVLQMFTPVARYLCEHSVEMKKSLYQILVQQISLASSRAYASVPWDDSEIAQPLVVHSLWSVIMDDNSYEMNELKVLDHPNVRFACWVTEVLRTSTKGFSNSKELIHVWTLGLRSPGTRLKIVVARMLLSFLQTEEDQQQNDQEIDELVRGAVTEVFDTERIKDVACRLMSRSGTVSLHAVASKYSMAMNELSASVCMF